MQPIQPPPSSPHTYIPSQSPSEQFHNFSAHQSSVQQQTQAQQPLQQQQQQSIVQQQPQVFIAPIYLSGSDGYVASPSAGFSAPQSGPPHQGPPAVLRGIQSTPPAPPQQDLNKMQQPTQSIFVQPGTGNTSGNVRAAQPANIFRGATTNSAPRAPRHNMTTLPPTMYPPQIQQVVMPYTPFPTRQPTSQLYSSAPSFHFSQTQMPTNFAGYPFYFPTNSILSTQHRPSVPSGIVQQPSGPTMGPTGSQGQMAMSSVLTPTGQTGAVTSSGSGSTTTKRKAARPHAIPIIHPESHKNVLEEMELSKSQSTSSAEVEYQEHVGDLLVSGSVGGVPSSTQQQDQHGMIVDSGSKNAVEGVAYIDGIQHHKIGAMSPCQPSASYNQVSESTPIVSAMSDGPSIDIPPKHQASKKKTKSSEIMTPQTSTSHATTEKQSENKIQSVHSGLIKESTSGIPEDSETISTCSFSTTTTGGEEDTETKAIQSKSDSDSTGNIQESTCADTDESSIEQSGGIKLQRSSSPPTNSNQQVQSLTSQTQLEFISQQSQATKGQANASSSARRDAKISFPTTALALNTTSSLSTPTSCSVSNVSAPISSGSGSNVLASKSEKIITSAPTFPFTATSISAALAASSKTTGLSAANVLASSAIKQGKGKEKHHQQQQISTAALAATSGHNNNQSPVSSEDPVKSKHSVTNNNIQQANAANSKQQGDKMKLDKDERQQKIIADKKDSATYRLSASGVNKVSDKNENIIQYKTYPSKDGDGLRTDSPACMTEVNSDVGDIYTQVTGTTAQASLDETDKVSSPPDDNVTYHKRIPGSGSGSPNNNDTIKSSTTQRSKSDDGNKSSKMSRDSPPSTLPPSKDSGQAILLPRGGDVNSNERATSRAAVAHPIGGSVTNGHVAPPTLKAEVKPIPQTLIKYNDGQWSPSNPDGAKTYDRQQLMILREAPASKAKPDKVPVCISSSARSPQAFMLPTFALNSNKRVQSMGARNLSIGGGISSASNASSLKQASMSGVSAKSSSKGSKSGIIHLSLSLREDVKLNETENAWRPTHLKHDDSKPADVIEKEELYRRVRGILNKLTPEKFETLVEQIMKLQIDTPEKINKVMELVFEKAVDEPNFSVSYACLCQRLSDIKLAEDSREMKLNFKGALIDKTENEFGQNVLKRVAKNRLQPIILKIHECTDPDRKLELQATLEEEERKIRRRSGGTVRFIGELFKISMLTANIINTCIESLLDQSSEDKLECLCKLLETVGKKFEEVCSGKESKSIGKDGKQRVYNLDNVIKRMQAIADRKPDNKISSRVRFMLQDVIDLRKNKWTSTRVDLNPKTMEQIQKEAKTEQISSQYMNYNILPTKKDDRRYGGSGGGSAGGGMSFGSSTGGAVGGGSNVGSGYFNKGRQQQSDDTWYTQTGKGSRAVDTSKLGLLSSSTNIDSETRLGNSSQFIWSNYGGTGLRQQSSTPTTATTNSFAALSSLDSNKGSSGGGGARSKGSYNKGSMERDKYEGVHSRTGSSHGSRESSSSRNPAARGGSSSVQQKVIGAGYQTYQSGSTSAGSSSRTAKPGTAAAGPAASNASQISSAPPAAVFDELRPDQNQAIISALNEMIDIVIDNKIEECAQVVKKFRDGERWGFLYNIFCYYLHLGKTKYIHRVMLARIILFLLNNNLLSLEHFKRGYQEFCELAADTVIDVPDAWNYVFQFMVPLIHKKIITIKDIWNDTLKETGQGEKFLKNLILQCTHEIGPKFTVNLWTSSNYQWTDFLNKDDVDQFIKDNQFQFIESNDANPPLQQNPDVHKIMDRVKDLLNDAATTDDIFDYIRGNIATQDVGKSFMRGLTTTLCNYAIQKNRNYVLDQKRFQNVCIPLLHRYIDTQEDRELECLYAIQVLVNSLEHPSGLLNELFAELVENEVIPQESFVKWRDSKEEPAGKGVAVKGLNTFFNNILSGETSDENN